MVFLVLAAQYESWSLPLAVILVVPMCLLSAIIGVNLADMDINIFTQIGFVVLVGLASKNAVLIVEYAKVQRLEGKSRREAALEACHLRLRPIIMTSFAFILGVVPLILSQGAGAEMRRTLGTAVFSGMLGVTLFGLALTPVFFYTIDWLGESRLFASRAMRWIGAIGLDILTLRPARRAVGYMATRVIQRRQGKSKSAPRSSPSTSEHGASLTASNGHASAAGDAAAPTNGHAPAATNGHADAGSAGHEEIDSDAATNGDAASNGGAAAHAPKKPVKPK
jgi:multidrug efflux pump